MCVCNDVYIIMQVQGLGPVFQLAVNLFNSSSTSSLRDLGITFKCDESLHRIHKMFIQVIVSIVCVCSSGDCQHIVCVFIQC